MLFLSRFNGIYLYLGLVVIHFFFLVFMFVMFIVILKCVSLS
jgi:hypothetical protein